MEGLNPQYEKTWDKLESVLNVEDNFIFQDINPKTMKSVRKVSANSSRLGSRHHEARSISTSKESPCKRPSTSSSSHSRSFSSCITIPGLTASQVQTIYVAKCNDLGIPVLQDQEKRFFNFCANFKSRTFSIRESGLGSNSAQKIGEIIKNNNYFAYIDLSKNALKDEGAMILLRSIKKSMSIVHLDISSNEITAEGSQGIINELTHHNSLASFDISSHEGLHRNRIGLQGAQAFVSVLQTNKILAFLNLAGTGLGPEGLECLIEGLRGNLTLTSLNISSNYFGPKPIENLAVALLNTDLRELDISMNKIGNEGCEYISMLISGGYDGFCTIMKFDLSENEITTTGVGKLFAALRINSQVKHMNLEKNLLGKGLSQNLLQFLMENIALESLNLNSCELSAEGLVGLAEGLAKNNGIKQLYLNNNQIIDKGAEIVAFALAKNKVIKLIDLSSNKIRDKGGIALARSLQLNESLETMHLRDNMLKDEPGQMLSEISRFKHNILKLTLDINPMNFKYIHDIKTNVYRNYQFQQKQLVPNLQKIIDKIQIKGNSMDDMHLRITQKQKEKNDAENKLKNQGNKLENIKDQEESKFQELREEYNTLRESSLKLSAEIDDLTMQMNVKYI